MTEHAQHIANVVTGVYKNIKIFGEREKEKGGSRKGGREGTFSTSLINRETYVKRTMKYHFTLVYNQKDKRKQVLVGM